MSSATKELRYRQSGAVYGNLAYDLDRELRERELRHAGELPRRREQAVDKPRVRSISKVQVRQKESLSAFSVVGFAAVAVLAVAVLLCYVQLTALSSQTVELQSQLSQLQEENVVLTAQYERMFDLNTIKEAAEAAGMSKPSSSQVSYIDLSEGDSAVVYEQKEPGLVSRILSKLHHGVYAVVEYFD